MTGLYARKDIDASMREWSSRLLSVVKLKYTVKSAEPVHFLKDRCYIIMSNHSSLYDIPLYSWGCQAVSACSQKKELFRVPIWGAAMKRAEFMSIDRQQKMQAAQDLQYAREKW